MTKTLLARLALLAAGAGTIGGCASAQPPAAGHAAVPRPVADLVLQGPAYRADARVQDRARRVLVRRCMAARGFAAGTAGTRGHRRALDGSDARRATVRPAGGMEMSYRTGGCEARAIARLHGSLAAYYTAVSRQNAAVMRTLARLPEGGDAAPGTVLRAVRPADVALLGRIVHERRAATARARALLATCAPWTSSTASAAGRCRRR